MFVLDEKENNICKIMCHIYRARQCATLDLCNGIHRSGQKKKLKSGLTLSNYCLSSTRLI